MRNTLRDQEQQEKVRDMDIISLAKFVFRFLKKNLSSNHDSSDCFYPVEDLRKALFPDGIDNKSGSDHAALAEAVALLERRGLLVRDFSYPLRPMSEDAFIVYLTSIGEKSDFDGEVILLVDKPEEIVGALEQKVGVLDSVVRQYYLESLRAYQEGLYISSVICLGAASERAIHWLAESIEPYSGPDQAGIKKRRKGHILELIKYLSDPVIPNTFGTDKELAEELKKRLNGLGDVYRENRNEAGHPQTVEQSWSREDQQILLLQFDGYITTICKAINYFV